MEYLRLSRQNEEDLVRKAIDVLISGGIVAFPTETFYALGAKYDREDALMRLYELKRRPFEKAIPVMIGSSEQLPLIARDVPEEAVRLMEKYWPGPLTMVLKAEEGVSTYLTAGTAKVAVRVPGESFALALVRRAGFPVTATSANPSGVSPAEDAQAVLKYFGETLDLIIDGGQTPGGLPSTIVEIVNGEVKILRKGRMRKVTLD
ncbi:MAG: threonylcarbamoyl-AMP synthase [Nitrospirae bacterium]|nr:threonylcarbamoyl-AMP synthase [Nitrospirota bacterium]